MIIRFRITEKSTWDRITIDFLMRLSLFDASVGHRQRSGYREMPLWTNCPLWGSGYRCSRMILSQLGIHLVRQEGEWFSGTRGNPVWNHDSGTLVSWEFISDRSFNISLVSFVCIWIAVQELFWDMKIFSWHSDSFWF
jgi:hypothetical protein